MQQLSVIDICNRALTMIRAETISALTEGSPSANAVNILYPSIVRNLLSSYKWQFANESVALSLATGITVPNWTYVYVYPVNCLQVNGIEYNPLYETEPDYAIKYSATLDCQVICSNTENIVLNYTIDITNPVVFSPLFVQMIVLQLACDLVKPLNSTLKDVKYYEEKLKICAFQAITQNARAGHISKQTDNGLMKIRRGTSDYIYYGNDQNNSD